MGDHQMCFDDVLAFRYFNQKNNCQHISNMNYLNRLGYACESCALENYRSQDVNVIKSFLNQYQSEINNVSKCCCSEIKEDIRSLKKLFNNFQQDREYLLDENKRLKTELEELKRRVGNTNEQDKLNISVTLTDARDLNVNISTKRQTDLKSLKISFDRTAEKNDCNLKKASDANGTKHCIKSERKIWLNESQPKVETVQNIKPKQDERIYKSDFLTHVRPRVKDIVHHYNNELRILEEKQNLNLNKVTTPGSSNRLVHPEIKMFQRQEKIRNVWVSENRLVNRSGKK